MTVDKDCSHMCGFPVMKEDVFYQCGFVDSNFDTCAPYINNVYWYGANEQEPLPGTMEEVLDMQLKQRFCFNFDKPIC